MLHNQVILTFLNGLLLLLVLLWLASIDLPSRSRHRSLQVFLIVIF